MAIDHARHAPSRERMTSARRRTEKIRDVSPKASSIGETASAGSKADWDRAEQTRVSRRIPQENRKMRGDDPRREDVTERRRIARRDRRRGRTRWRSDGGLRRVLGARDPASAHRERPSVRTLVVDQLRPRCDELSALIGCQREHLTHTIEQRVEVAMRHPVEAIAPRPRGIESHEPLICLRERAQRAHGSSSASISSAWHCAGC